MQMLPSSTTPGPRSRSVFKPLQLLILCISLLVLQDAARLRDRVKQLQPPPPPPPPPAIEQPGFDPTAVTVSDKVTDGIRVTCRSFFVPSESRPAASPPLFLFG